MPKTLTLTHHASLNSPYWVLSLDNSPGLPRRVQNLATLPDAPLQRRMLGACLDIALGDLFSADDFEITAPLAEVETLIKHVNPMGSGFVYLARWIKAARAGQGEVVE